MDRVIAFAGLPCRLPSRQSPGAGVQPVRATASSSPPSSGANAPVSRRAVLSGAALAALATVLPGPTRAEEFSTASGLKVNVLKKGSGPKIETGDLVALRFKGSYGGVAFDDIYGTPQPYFYRCGSEALLKGIVEAVSLMSVGDEYELSIPGNLAFGQKGRRASPGKPAIPPNATVTYTLLAESIPGRMEELLEVTGGEGLDDE